MIMQKICCSGFFFPKTLGLGFLFSLGEDDRLKIPSALMSFETRYGFRKLHPWAFRLKFHQEWQMLHQDEEGFWTMPPGKVASQVKSFMTADHGQAVCVGGKSSRIRKRTYSLQVICFNLNLVYSRLKRRAW